MDYPVFGEKLEGKNYQPRFAAYVILADKKKQRVVLVQAPNGAYFLPGGEIEAGETKEMAVEREMIEELGVRVILGRYYGQANEYFFSRHRNTYYFNPGYFFEVTNWEVICEPTEMTNQLLWTSPQKALKLLKRGSHQWAVQQWLKQMNG